MKIKECIFLSSQEALIRNGKYPWDSLEASTVLEVSTQIMSLVFHRFQVQFSLQADRALE